MTSLSTKDVAERILKIMKNDPRNELSPLWSSERLYDPLNIEAEISLEEINESLVLLENQARILRCPPTPAQNPCWQLPPDYWQEWESTSGAAGFGRSKTTKPRCDGHTFETDPADSVIAIASRSSGASLR
jgi:hypothetical protein